MHRLLLAGVVVFAAGSAHAQSTDSTRSLPPLPTIHAAHAAGAIHVDGRLDEASWHDAEPATVFTQLDPHEGSPASESTAVRVLVGDDALYVGARLLDHDASRIRARLARRDDPVESDVFNVYIDSYRDHLTAWHFRVNPAGAIYDATVGADGNEDSSWDPVWESAARVDGDGWTAEIRIPFSQLRYTPSIDTEFGVQFDRTIFRTGEVDLFAFTPKSETGGVSRFGTLTGLGRLPTPRRLEILPYVAARNERLLFPENDPFRSGNDMFGAVGGDLKYGLSSSFTLDATVNPDFGQVEVDPAEVNLTAFETFFPEKRQFFVEGADLFTFARTRSFNNYGFVRVYHSRRIGRAPQRGLSPFVYDFVDAPPQTTILGAAKVAGRTPSGWSLGVLDALTAKEGARVLDGATQMQSRETVEPFTHYLVARATRDLRQGNTKVGAIVTSVNRRLDDPGVTALYRRDAYLGGLDLNHAWAHRRYAVDADVSVSQIRGSADAIALAQRSSARYYQRPDHADYAVYDPTRTSLAGYGLDASLAKTAGLHTLWSLAYASKSPGYEVNDVGFATRSDYRALSEILLYTETKPGKIFRSWTAFPFLNQTWNFGGDIIYNGRAFDLGGTLRNYWYLHGRYTQAGRSYDDRLTRGGPQARLPRTFNWSVDCTSDSRKPWSVSPSYSHSWNDRGGWGDGIAFSVSARPSPTIRISAGPQFNATHALAQYVAAITDDEAVSTYGRRYVFATLDQRSASLDLRLDWTFTPRLSLQFYAQPLIVAGDFHNLKEFTTPRDFLFDVYGVDRGTITRDADGIYTIDPGNGRTFQLADPDFDVRSLLGNAVLRWEYRPGSTLFVVWQHRRADVEPIGEFRLGHDLDALLHADAENVIAVKATYWIGL